VFNEQRVVVRSRRMGGDPSIYIDPTRVLNYDALWIKQ
jgi:peptide/nickel transport system substrate-binding protein/oligopeptide transport system substrate-binding protein